MIDRDRLADLNRCEVERFIADRPKSMAWLERGRRVMPDGVPMAWMVCIVQHPPMFIAEGEGAYITDIDGNRYLDMNLSDMSMAAGYGLPAVADAVDRQFRKGASFLLPVEDAVLVAEEMARRYRAARWQFTLAASTANAEVLRIARAFTKRDRILLFDGKYHGHIDPILHQINEGRMEPEGLGLPMDAGANTVIVPFNDLEAVEKALKSREIACVLTEPAFTNGGGILMPDPGFHQGLRELTKRYDTLLIMDETHTHVCTYGGIARAWALDFDVFVLGKTLGGGIPIGAYGLNDELAHFMEMPGGNAPLGQIDRVATGGTMFANALQFAAARATLEHVLTEENHARAEALGSHLADGIEAAIARTGLPWSTWRLFIRSGYHCAPVLPRNQEEKLQGHDVEVKAYIRHFMANRGVWEAVIAAGPAVSLAAGKADVDFYIDVLNDCLDTLVG